MHCPESSRRYFGRLSRINTANFPDSTLDVSQQFAWQNLVDYIPRWMREQDRLEWKLKAEAFDRLVETYQGLEDHDGFYSRNWLELSEQMETELKQLSWILRPGKTPSGSS